MKWIHVPEGLKLEDDNGILVASVESYGCRALRGSIRYRVIIEGVHVCFKNDLKHAMAEAERAVKNLEEETPMPKIEFDTTPRFTVKNDYEKQTQTITITQAWRMT